MKTITTFNTDKADITVGVAIDWKSAALIGIVLCVAITLALMVYRVVQ